MERVPDGKGVSTLLGRPLAVEAEDSSKELAPLEIVELVKAIGDLLVAEDDTTAVLDWIDITMTGVVRGPVVDSDEDVV